MQVRFVVSQSLSGVDAVDRVGATALHQACARGHDQLVRQLLQFGADPNLRDLSHFTPLQLARGKGHTEIVQVSSWLNDEAAMVSTDVAADASAGGRRR